jgi:hypothetical protein
MYSKRHDALWGFATAALVHPARPCNRSPKGGASAASGAAGSNAGRGKGGVVTHGTTRSARGGPARSAMRGVCAVTAALSASVLAAAFVGGAGARIAEPPPNDDRASAQVIAAFPATIDGTTVGATVERLDPQRSQCGTVESTVWYRINQAPDGTVSVAVQGAGLAPVVRVYNITKSGITELDCAAAKASGTAKVVWETTRGNSYLVLVGKKPGTADAGFRLTAQLFLPPTNDSARQATRIALRTQIKGTTLGATSDESDPDSCGLVGGTIWYSVSPGRSVSRVIVRLHAESDFDAALVVLRKVRSQTENIGCVQTDRKGDALAAWDVERGAVYLIVIGQRRGSPPGDFSLQALAAQPGEVAPGQQLRPGGIRSRVDWLTDVNDVWWTTLVPGTTYRIAFSSQGCADLTIRRKGRVFRSFRCGGYTTFTPRPDTGGRYVFEVTASARPGTTPYRLKVLPAGPDDVGVGLPLANLATARGALAPGAGDVIDLYHFDVTALSDVRLREEGGSFSIVLLTFGGGQLSSSVGEVDRTLGAGHYVAAVRASPGAPGGAYRLTLVVREVTKTMITASSAQISPGSSVSFAIAISPPPDGGVVDVEVDRFDTLAGWHFHLSVRLHAGGVFSWTPPAPGRWRARASFLGTIRYSPSRSGYSTILVAKPVVGA